LKLDLFKQLDLFFTYLSPTAAALIIPLIITSIVFDGTSRMILLGLFLLQMLSISMVNDGPSKIHKAKLVLIALLYMILQSAICLTAVFLALLSIDLKWTKTEKSGFHIVHTSEDSPKSSLRKACGSQDMLKVLIKEYTTT